MRKISFLFVLFLMAMPLGARADVVKGDVNADGLLNITDVSQFVNYLLNEQGSTINQENADISDDGLVNITDVTLLIELLLSMQYEYVDLGLPSGTLWATCNIGARAPEDYGSYFAWGETEPKDYYYWDNYKWCNGTFDTMIKYCIFSKFGTVDNKTELDLEDDAAYVNWGSSWRMPSWDQFEELRTQCTWTKTTLNGVNGRLGTGPNGNTLFLPAAGLRVVDILQGAGTEGFYWGRELYPYAEEDDETPFAAVFSFDSEHIARSGLSPLAGISVRPVRVTQD